MNRVTRDEVRSRAEYDDMREAFRAEVMAQKRPRRIHLGPYFTFLFENHDTVLYQIQEMIRAEGIEGEAAIQHEIDTYNELLGDRGELGVTLLIEIDDPAKRDELLSRWTSLPGTFYIETREGKRIGPQFDRRQVSDARISSVHYIKFRVGDGVPHRIGCSHPDIDTAVVLSADQVAALAGDLVAGSPG